MIGPEKRRTTRDTNAAKRARIARYFAVNPNARLESNRHIAGLLEVDESTVREYRKAKGIPSLLPGTGMPEPAEKKGRRKKR